MNNLNIFENTFAGFIPTLTPAKNHWNNNCPGNCQAQINGYPFWIKQQPLWPYKCACRGQRIAKPGQKPKECLNWGGNYD